jgi:hypothetical protein
VRDPTFVGGVNIANPARARGYIKPAKSREKSELSSCNFLAICKEYSSRRVIHESQFDNANLRLYPPCGVVGLKVQSTSGGSTLTLLSPRVQRLGMEVEAMVGIWLVSGYARQGAWLVAVGLFATLSAVSAYLGWIGQPSCGCFGRVEVSPWGSLTLDLACVIALGVARPSGQWLSRKTLLPVLLAIFVACGLVVANLSDGVRREVARVRGDSLRLTGGDLDAGVAPKGESRIVPVTVENLTASDIRLIGGNSSCDCVATSDLPLTIPAGSKSTANVRIKFTGEKGRFMHTFVWYADAPAQTQLSGSVIGQVE